MEQILAGLASVTKLFRKPPRRSHVLACQGLLLPVRARDLGLSKSVPKFRLQWLVGCCQPAASAMEGSHSSYYPPTRVLLLPQSSKVTIADNLTFGHRCR